jgi:hypothetical protein
MRRFISVLFGCCYFDVQCNNINYGSWDYIYSLDLLRGKNCSWDSKFRWDGDSKMGLEEIWHRQGSGGTQQGLMAGSVDTYEASCYIEVGDFIRWKGYQLLKDPELQC